MNRHTRLVFSLMFGISVNLIAQQNNSTAKSYVKVPSGYLMVLREGDDVFKALEAFALAENIPSSNFTGMGFVNLTFGFFDFKSKDYIPRDFTNVELASLHGTLAWKDGKPSIHAHGVISDKTFQAYGGHILKADVSTGSLEIMLTIHDKAFQRKHDPGLGADILDLHSR